MKKLTINCTRRLISIAVVLVLLAGLMTGCSAPKEKTFTSNGMTVTLTSAFVESEMEGFDVVIDSKDVAVFALREEFSLFEGFGDYTEEEYGELAIQINELDSDGVKTVDGLVTFEYTATNDETNETYRYFDYVFKSNSAFWLVQFAMLEKNVEKYGAQVPEWAKTVTFSD